MEADPNIIQLEQSRYQTSKKEAILEYMIESRSVRISSIPRILTEQAETCYTGTLTEGIQVQNDLENEDILEFDTKKSKEYRIEKSSSSFSFQDLTGFVYGPVTSRFWMLRKLILNMDK